jgi:hypothetical protein
MSFPYDSLIIAHHFSLSFPYRRHDSVLLTHCILMMCNTTLAKYRRAGSDDALQGIRFP